MTDVLGVEVPDEIAPHVRRLIQRVGSLSVVAADCDRAAVDGDIGVFEVEYTRVQEARQHAVSAMIMTTIAWTETLRR